jgi:hypothetical protein
MIFFLTAFGQAGMSIDGPLSSATNGRSYPDAQIRWFAAKMSDTELLFNLLK